LTFSFKRCYGSPLQLKVNPIAIKSKSKEPQCVKEFPMPKITHPKTLLITLVLVLTILSLPLMNARATGWDYVGTPGFSNGIDGDVLLALDSTNTPYVAFLEEFPFTEQVTVMKFNGSSWEVVGTAGFSGEASDVSLALDSNDMPYVAFKDYTNSFKATVMKFNGNSWETVGTAGFSADAAYDISLALDSSDTPYIAYQDGDNNSFKVTAMKYTGSGDSGWEEVGTAGFSAGQALYISLVLDSTDTPYVGYRDQANSYKATVMKYTGSGDSGWEEVGTVGGFSAGRADYLSLALDSTGVPYVSYSDDVNSDKATVMKYDATNGWELVGSAGFSAGRLYNSWLALDSTNTPYLAFVDFLNSDKPSLMKYTDSGDSGWENVGIPGFSLNVSGEAGVSLALDSNNAPYVAMNEVGYASVMTFGGTPNTPEMRLSSVQNVESNFYLGDGDSLDLGNALVGNTLQTEFQIENTGDADLTLTGSPAVSISGANADDFTLTAQPTSPVAPGSSVTFTLEFTPGATGIRSATLNIANNDSNENPYTVILQGSGVALPESALYWTNRDDSAIYIADRSDGSDIVTLTDGLDEPHDLAVDAINGKLYYTDPGNEIIYRSDLDGSNL
jgi:hypothetical protein